MNTVPLAALNLGTNYLSIAIQGYFLHCVIGDSECRTYRY